MIALGVVDRDGRSRSVPGGDRVARPRPDTLKVLEFAGSFAAPSTVRQVSSQLIEEAQFARAPIRHDDTSVGQSHRIPHPVQQIRFLVIPLPDGDLRLGSDPPAQPRAVRRTRVFDDADSGAVADLSGQGAGLRVLRLAGEHPQREEERWNKDDGQSVWTGHRAVLGANGRCSPLICLDPRRRHGRRLIRLHIEFPLLLAGAGGGLSICIGRKVLRNGLPKSS